VVSLPDKKVIKPPSGKENGSLADNKSKPTVKKSGKTKENNDDEDPIEKSLKEREKAGGLTQVVAGAKP